MDRGPQQPRMQHAGQADIGGVAGGPRDLLAPVEACRRAADDPEFSRRAQLGPGFDDPRDGRAMGKRRVPDGARRCIHDADDTLGNLQAPERSAQSTTGQGQQRETRLGRGGAQHRAEHAGAQRAKGAHVHRATVGVAQHHVDRCQRYAQLLRHHLCLGGHHTLAHFDLPGEHRDAAVGANGEVGVEVLGLETPASLGACSQRCHAHQHDNPAATQLNEVAAVECRARPRRQRGRHLAAPPAA